MSAPDVRKTPPPSPSRPTPAPPTPQRSRTIRPRKRAGRPAVATAVFEPPKIVESGSNVKSGVAIVGHFSKWAWGQHPDEAYMADALESLGVVVYRVDQDRPDNPSHIPTEWAIFTGASSKLLPRWKPSHKTILWTLDWLPGYEERKPIIEMGRQATLFVSSDQHNWAAQGIPHHVYLPGACESTEEYFRPMPSRPVAFLGAIYNDRRKVIADLVKSLGGDVISRPGEWVYGPDLMQFVQQTKIIIGDNVLNDCRGYWSTRNYVIPGAGGFLLTAYVPGLEKTFRFNEHIAVYRSLAELPTQVGRWLTMPAKREEIRKKGYRWVRDNHNWKMRAREFLNIMARAKVAR